MSHSSRLIFRKGKGKRELIKYNKKTKVDEKNNKLVFSDDFKNLTYKGGNYAVEEDPRLEGVSYAVDKFDFAVLTNTERRKQEMMIEAMSKENFSQYVGDTDVLSELKAFLHCVMSMSPQKVAIQRSQVLVLDWALGNRYKQCHLYLRENALANLLFLLAVNHYTKQWDYIDFNWKLSPGQLADSLEKYDDILKNLSINRNICDDFGNLTRSGSIQVDKFLDLYSRALELRSDEVELIFLSDLIAGYCTVVTSPGWSQNQVGLEAFQTILKQSKDIPALLRTLCNITGVLNEVKIKELVNRRGII